MSKTVDALDWIENPLQIIDQLYGEDASALISNAKNYFTDKLKDTQVLKQIPSLNDVALHNLRTHSLVRMRCMVQDMFDPEYYLGEYEVLDRTTSQQRMVTGQYRDLAQCKDNEEILMNSSKNVTLDRQTLYCVPVPGENIWVKSEYSQGSCQPVSASTSSENRQKRSFEDETDTPTNNASSDTATMETETSADSEAKTAESKKPKTEGNSEKSGVTGPSLNFPLAGETGPACLAKIYDSDLSLKLNEVIEFIGVLSNDPALAAFAKDGEKSAFVAPGEDIMEGVEEDGQHLPPSLVPRLHVILTDRLQHTNPYIPRNITNKLQEVKDLLEQCNEIRSQLITALTKALLGDRVAAEYLLFNLISTVHARHDVVALGKFAVNISGCPAESGYTRMLYHLLQQLTTKSHFFPMTIENLNNGVLMPAKDYKLNRLTSGMLQLSDGTLLVLDETAMQPGQLDTKGVQNLTALGTEVRWQRVEYDFSFHKKDFETNLPVLVLSEGKSMIQCDVQVPLAPSDTDSNFEVLRRDMTPELLIRWRSYLSLVRLLPYELQDDVQKQVESDFVEMRKQDPKNMTVDDFHGLLTIARLLTLSHGLPGLTLDVWKEAKSLESQRKQRISPATATCA